MSLLVAPHFPHMQGCWSLHLSCSKAVQSKQILLWFHFTCDWWLSPVPFHGVSQPCRPSSSVKCLFRVLPVLFGWFVFFLLSWSRSLHMTGRSHWSGAEIADTFLQFIVCLLTPLWAYQTQKVLSSWNPIHVVFSSWLTFFCESCLRKICWLQGVCFLLKAWLVHLPHLYL